MFHYFPRWPLHRTQHCVAPLRTCTQATELLLSLQHAPDVHALDGHGLSAIHHACLGGDPLVVRTLAGHGAALDPADLEGGAHLLGLGAEVRSGGRGVVWWGAQWT